MQYCLNKRELDLLVDNDWNLPEDDEFVNLALIQNQCKSWELEMICFSYFLSQTLERKSKTGADCQAILRKTFEHSSDMWLLIQQFDLKFINYIFRYVRDKNMELEDELIEAQIKLGQHIYE